MSEAGGQVRNERSSAFDGAAWSAPITVEADRWALWVPVCFGIGIALYFWLPVEPTLLAVLMPAVGGVVAWWLWRLGAMGPLLAASLCCVALGVLAAKFRTLSVEAPILAVQVKALAVEGRIVDLEPRPDRGPRLTLAVTRFGDWPAETWPARVRIRLLTPASGLRHGQLVRIVADLSPPFRPSEPGAYDPARAAFFQRIGAIGFAFAAPEPIPEAASAPLWMRARAQLDELRAQISGRIMALVPGQPGAIASALITGERGAIAPETTAAFRDSGLAHLLVISGLHMAIVTGAAFVLLRSGLALVPAIALRLATKKWAAVMAALFATAYLLISGGAIATVRAYIMVLVMVVAVLLDRPALALRNVAIAALVILIVTPESLLNAGFQMSFAAVVALISAYEAVRDRRAKRPRQSGFGLGAVVVRGLLAIAFTTLIASLAVAPVAAYHFQRSQQYAVLANVLAGPIMNLWIMPSALASMLAMPFGLDAGPLWIMGQGIGLTAMVASWVAGLPGAMTLVPAVSWWSFAIVVVGGLWLTLWRRRWRLWGAAIIAVGIGLSAWRMPPDLLIGQNGHLAAVRDSSGHYIALGSRGRRQLERWLIRDGDSRPVSDVLAARRARCDGAGCWVEIEGLRVALSKHPSALADDCRNADILVLPFPRPEGCVGPRLVIDRAAIQNAGTHALHLQRGEMSAVVPQPAANARATLDRTFPTITQIKTTTVDEIRGRRPWVLTQADRRATWEVIDTLRGGPPPTRTSIPADGALSRTGATATADRSDPSQLLQDDAGAKTR